MPGGALGSAAVAPVDVVVGAGGAATDGVVGAIGTVVALIRARGGTTTTESVDVAFGAGGGASDDVAVDGVSDSIAGGAGTLAGAAVDAPGGVGADPAAVAGDRCAAVTPVLGPVDDDGSPRRTRIAAAAVVATAIAADAIVQRDGQPCRRVAGAAASIRAARRARARLGGSSRRGRRRASASTSRSRSVGGLVGSVTQELPARLARPR
ncbi:MAG TPA: hypothetical protein VFK02_06385, partial [Kofleriaceae bacterium]|nr:hypothetical protein [Kofleriaceae bacterium]